MKVALFFALFCILQITVYAWVGIIKANPEEALKHNAFCYTDSDGIGALEKNEVKRIQGQCATAACQENGDISLTGCAVVAAEPPCYVAQGNLSKPFPQCCFEIICPEEKFNYEEKHLNTV